MTIARVAALCGLALLLSAPAAAQNLSMRAPQWAQPLLSADVTPTTGGRAALAAEGVSLSVRVTIAPPRGGVARVIRFDERADAGALAVRRFTGHPATGWWLWGPDAPRVTQPSPAQRAEIGALVRAVMGAAGSLGAADEACAAGEQAFVEAMAGGRSTSFSRACVTGEDAVGRLTLRLSELAGSRTEEELAAAAVAELLETERAFAAKAAADGVPAAFAAYAADNALLVSSTALSSGREAVAQRFADWPEGARLEWTPEAARVSARGDMGWSWGNSVYVAPDGTRTPGRYVSVWTRDLDGNWRFAFDAPIR